jgi:hypothetical protein
MRSDAQGCSRVCERQNVSEAGLAFTVLDLLPDRVAFPASIRLNCAPRQLTRQISETAAARPRCPSHGSLQAFSKSMQMHFSMKLGRHADAHEGVVAGLPVVQVPLAS